MDALAFDSEVDFDGKDYNYNDDSIGFDDVDNIPAPPTRRGRKKKRKLTKAQRAPYDARPKPDYPPVFIMEGSLDEVYARQVPSGKWHIMIMDTTGWRFFSEWLMADSEEEALEKAFEVLEEQLSNRPTVDSLGY